MGKKKPKKQSPKKSAKKSDVKVKGKKQINALEEERSSLQAQIAELQQKLQLAQQSTPEPEPSVALPSLDIPFKREPHAQDKIDWERYSYLHDRYEIYIEKGAKVEQARKQANEDLMEKFGKKAGYTDEQLECIFL